MPFSKGSIVYKVSTTIYTLRMYRSIGITGGKWVARFDFNHRKDGVENVEWIRFDIDTRKGILDTVREMEVQFYSNLRYYRFVDGAFESEKPGVVLGGLPVHELTQIFIDVYIADLKTFPAFTLSSDDELLDAADDLYVWYGHATKTSVGINDKSRWLVERNESITGVERPQKKSFWGTEYVVLDILNWSNWFRGNDND